MKQDLLQTLLSSEQSRLLVWLYPLENTTRGQGWTEVRISKYYFSLADISQENVCRLLPVAWEENPAIAIHFVSRFSSQRVTDSVRWFLLNQTELAIHEPDALQVLLGSSLPHDVSSQLKVGSFPMN